MPRGDIQQVYGARISDFELFLYFYEVDLEWRQLFEIQVGSSVNLDQLQDMLGPQLPLYLSEELDSPIFDNVIEVMNGLRGRKLPSSDLICYRFGEDQDEEMDFIVGKCLQVIPHTAASQVPSEVILQVAMIPYWISKTILELDKLDILHDKEHTVFLVHKSD